MGPTSDPAEDSNGTAVVRPRPVGWPPATSWSNRVQSIGGAALFASFALLMIPGVFNGGKGGVGNQVFAGVIILACVAMSARSAIASSARSSATGVRVWALLRTRHYGWEDVHMFESRLGRVGIVGYTRKVFAVVTVDGVVRLFEDLNCSLRSDSLDRCVAALNAELVASRSHG